MTLIEEFVLSHLKQNLDVPVYLEIPKDIPKQFVLLMKSGSARLGINLDRSSFSVQSYDESMYKASLLNKRVKKAMDDLNVYNEISKSKLDSDYNFTDPTSKQYRYQCVYDIIHYSED